MCVVVRRTVPSTKPLFFCLFFFAFFQNENAQKFDSPFTGFQIEKVRPRRRTVVVRVCLARRAHDFGTVD
jgi:hypothetical protein